MQSNTTEIFRDAPVPKAVLSNVIPSIISMIMVLIYNLADTFFIGQTKNALMVAAVSVATPAFLLFMAVGMLFGIGGTSFISRMLGEGQEARAKHASAFCFWTGLAVGIISMILIVIFAEPVCKAIGASADTVEYATQYLRIVAIGIPFLIISNAFSNIIRSEGRAKNRNVRYDHRKYGKCNLRSGHDLASRLECCRCRDCNRHRKYFIRGLLCIASSVK